MRTRHDVAPVGPGRRRAEHLPVFDRHQLHIRGDGLRQLRRRLVVVGEIRIRERALPGGVVNFPVPHLHRAALDLPLGAGELDQHIFGGGRGPAHQGNGARRSAAAVRAAVIRHLAGVGQDHLHLGGRHSELFGGGLGQFGAGALPALDLAGQHRDAAVLAQMEAGREQLRAPAPAAPLRQGRQGGREKQPRAQHFDKRTPAQTEIITHPLHRLVVLQLAVIRPGPGVGRFGAHARPLPDCVTARVMAVWYLT